MRAESCCLDGAEVLFGGPASGKTSLGHRLQPLSCIK